VLGGKATGHVSHQQDDFDFWVLRPSIDDTIHIDVDACNTCGSNGESHIRLELLAPDSITMVARGMPFDGRDSHLSYVVRTAGPYFVRVYVRHADRAYTLNFFEIKCPVAEREPNDSLTTALPMTAGETVHALLCPTLDRDLWSLRLEAGTTLEAGFEARVIGGEDDAPDLSLLTSAGSELVRSEHSRSASFRYEVPTTGTYYLMLRGFGGGLDGTYQLRTQVTGSRSPGPGDPTVVFEEDVPIPVAVAVKGNGELVIADPPERCRLLAHDRRTCFGLGPIAWDAFGNVLVYQDASGDALSEVRKRSPDRPHFKGKSTTLIPDVSALSLAVASDGSIWLSDARTRSLRHYSPAAQLIGSHDVSGVAESGAYNLAVGPGGDLYFSSGENIYRLSAGQPVLFLREGSGTGGQLGRFAFDVEGNAYVPVPGTGEIVLHDRAGGAVAAPWSWSPEEPIALAFGRNADGATNLRLFALDAGNLIELNKAGVRAAGLPRSFETACPSADEGEPNDTLGTARTISIGATTTGYSCPALDGDFFRVQVPADVRLEIDVQGADDAMLELIGPNAFHASDDDHVGRDPRIAVDEISGGTYYIAVRSHYGGPKSYTLRVQSFAPRSQPVVTAVRAAAELAKRGGVLSDAERAYLDEQGNDNGRYDVGDFRALLMREQGAAAGARP
jgi:hypothetical protein